MRGRLLFSLFLLLCGVAHSQTLRTIKQEINTISTYNTAHTPEKIFIQTDKQNYSKEDTIWFKAYVFDAASLGAPTKSGLMYIEIADESNRVVNRNMVSITAGLGWGNIPLVDDRFAEGTYTLRAYTNWMRNFDEHYIFNKKFTIEGPLDEDWMINSRFELNEIEGINNVKTNLAFITNEGHKMVAQELKARITAGKRTLYRTTLTTGVDGTLAFDFNLPDKVTAQDISISLTKKRTKQSGELTFNVPVIINRDEKTDLQFMPEGGSLIGGMLNRVAFKAINEEGKGVDVMGYVYNSKGKKIAGFRSIHMGMGVFDFKSEPGEVYEARINYHEKTLSFPLPQAKTSGLMLNIDHAENTDSIIVEVTASPDIQQAKGIYYLVGQSRNVVCYGAAMDARRGMARFSVHRSAFPTGVARFTLLSATNLPVAERLIFVDHHNQIKLNIAQSKPFYGNRDSISLSIIATDKKGAPVKGSFSIAITDNAQVKLDSTTLPNLPAKILLADDLKGEIENPAWYFTNGDAINKPAALDVLLLTQGWVNYNWTEVFAPVNEIPEYKAEPEFAVRGRVTNAFKKPLANSNIVLLSTKPTFVIDTNANALGEFAFTGLYPFDTVAYNLQAKNKRGRMFNVGIEVDEFKPPVFSATLQRLIPLYVNIDTAHLTAVRTRQLYKEETAKLTGTQLKEVQIKAKKGVKNSKSLVGPGEADFTLNEEDLKPQGKRTLLDILRENVKGFSSMTAHGPNYNINGIGTMFIVDGVKASKHMPLRTSYYIFITDLFSYINAEDVKGVEVMATYKNQGTYAHEYAPGAPPMDITFIEITTYSGYGLMFKKEPGNYLYRPPCFCFKKRVLLAKIRS